MRASDATVPLSASMATASCVACVLFLLALAHSASLSTDQMLTLTSTSDLLLDSMDVPGDHNELVRHHGDDAHFNESALFDRDDDVAYLTAEATRSELISGLINCNETRWSAAERTPGTLLYRIKRADCGLGYDFHHSAARYRHWNVVLYGPGWSGQTLEYSGCPVGAGRCPLSPQCSIVSSTQPRSAEKADVVVVFQRYADFVSHAHKRVHNDTDVKPTRVLYWREAVWPAPGGEMQRTMFDFGAPLCLVRNQH